MKIYKITEASDYLGVSINTLHDMGFDLDWCELDTDYYKAAKLRYKNHIQQMRMF